MVRVIGRRGLWREHVTDWMDALVGRLFVRPTPIQVVEQHCNFLPARFRWAGKMWRVRRVTRVWDEAATALLPPRRYFHVRCDDGGERILFQDLRLGMWYLNV